MRTSVWRDGVRVFVRNEDARCSALAWQDYGSQASAAAAVRRMTREPAAAERFYRRLRAEFDRV